MAALEAALDAWEGVDMHDVRSASIALADLFIRDAEARCPELVLASPRDGNQRGSQVSFRHPNGYAIMQALIARGVIGDFRAPDAIRFGFTRSISAGPRFAPRSISSPTSWTIATGMPPNIARWPP
jgi:Kynureninase